MTKRPPLVAGLCKAIHDEIGHRPPPYWTSLDPVRARLGNVPEDKLQAAARWALEHHLIATHAAEPPYVMVTILPAGVALVSRGR